MTISSYTGYSHPTSPGDDVGRTSESSTSSPRIGYRVDPQVKRVTSTFTSRHFDVERYVDEQLECLEAKATGDDPGADDPLIPPYEVALVCRDVTDEL